MNIEIVTSVAVGVLSAAAVIGGFFYVADNWYSWFHKPKKINRANLPYDLDSPLVKRFQFLAGITESYGGDLKSYRSRFNLRYM